jgi:hypothetical protein
MARIAAAVFADQSSAERAMAALTALGVADADVERFVVNPPGRHNHLPLGGDEDADDDAKPGDRGALAGAAVGSAVGGVAGVLAASIIGPAGIAGGIAAGAYTGALAGALNSMGRRPEPAVRPYGVMVAVNLDRVDDGEEVLDVLYDGGAEMIEQAQGEWRNGHWADFDPVAHPQHVDFREPK